MKRILMALAIGMATLAVAQDKPRVFVAGKGTQNVSTNASSGGNRWFRTGHAESTIDSHDESMEVTKDLQRECSGIRVTLNQSAADYTVMLARESKQKRSLLRTNNQMQVANRTGDVLGSNTTRTVNNATKDACNLILSDWAQHGRITAQSEPPAAPPLQAEKPAQPVMVAASVVTSVPATQETPQAEQTRADRNTVVVSAPAVSSVLSDSLAEAARRAKQRQACLKLAADNPSITCK
jgi:hypothetical protein